VLLIHHSGKDQARGMRGWSGILGALDTEIEVTWNKDKNRRAIWIKKQRDGESNVRLFDCVLERVTYGLDAKGREVSSVVVKQVEWKIPMRLRQLKILTRPHLKQKGRVGHDARGHVPDIYGATGNGGC